MKDEGGRMKMKMKMKTKMEMKIKTRMKDEKRRALFLARSLATPHGSAQVGARGGCGSAGCFAKPVEVRDNETVFM